MRNGQKKGSASAPTLPSRGSNKSSEDTAVNEQHDTTAPALAATFDPIAHADRLFKLKMLAGTASTLVNEALFEEGIRLKGLVAITPHQAQQLVFIVDEVEDWAKQAEAAFDARASETPPSSTAPSVSISKPDRRGPIDFEKAFFDLEEVIYVVQRRVKAVEFIVDGIDGRATLSNPRGAVSVHSDERDALHSAARDAAWAAEDLSRRFDSVTAETVTAGFATREAKKAGQDEAEEASASVVTDPLSTMILELRALRAREVEIADRSPVVDAELRPTRDAAMVVWRRLAHAAPVARTAAGAYLALEEALLDIDVGGGPLAPSLIRSALAYLGSAHVQ